MKYNEQPTNEIKVEKKNSKIKIVVREPEYNLKKILDDEILSPGISDQVATMEVT